jgi:poly(ADP-ribose) glycohydrolase ARH3
MMHDRFQGCLLGLALGDALGAPFEGGLIERLLWRFIGRTSRGEIRWTDDTQMSLDIAKSLVEKGAIDTDDLARRFVSSYRWSRGYGPGTAKLLRLIGQGKDWRDVNHAIYPTGSFGNGGAMRAPVVGIFYADRPEELPHAVRESARVTHAHPLALEGALLVAIATAEAGNGHRGCHLLYEPSAHCMTEPFKTRLKIATSWLEEAIAPSPLDVSRQLGSGIAAAESCVTALYLAVRFMEEPYVNLLRFAQSCGGDVDTISAIAGALWGTANGASRLPKDLLSRLEQRDRLVEAAIALYERAQDVRQANDG